MDAGNSGKDTIWNTYMHDNEYLDALPITGYPEMKNPFSAWKQVVDRRLHGLFPRRRDLLLLL
jgi:hypothetical protein